MKLSYSLKLSQACKVLGVSRQAYYQPIVKPKPDLSIISQITVQANEIRKLSPVRGCRAMYDRFGNTLPIGRDKSIDLLMDLGYRVRYPKRYGQATQSGTREFANLLVNKRLHGINEVWQADMAHYLYGERKYYTIYITDVYSQEVVGYGAYDTNLAVNYAQVMQQAIRKRGGLTNGLDQLIHHSDGGKQYESSVYKALCIRSGIIQSMCMYSYENPYAEKTNDLINNGYLNVWRPRSLTNLRTCQRKAVQDHNQNSQKKVLGKLSPNQFRLLLINKQLCTSNYELILKPINPTQPRKKVTLVNIN